jgi:hypothetical protein
MSHDTYKGEVPRHPAEDGKPYEAELQRRTGMPSREMNRVSDYVIKDSGQRAAFDSGMVRDVADDKPDTELIFNGPMADRWAEHLTKGAKKYPDVELGVPNWTLARGLEELVRFRKSAVRHFRQWLRGDRDEDHAAAVFFNINGAEYVRDRMAAAEKADARGNR